MDMRNVTLKITYEPVDDSAYIYFVDPAEAGSFGTTHGFTYACDPIEVDGMINLDFDVDGRLTGMEVLGARGKLPRSVLTSLT